MKKSTELKAKETLKFELFIAKFLRYGVFVAGIILFISWLRHIDFHRNVFSDYRTYEHQPLFATLWSLFGHDEYGLLLGYAGLFVLISLPLIRVLLTGIIFIKQRDYRMASLVALVIVGLIISISLGVEH